MSKESDQKDLIDTIIAEAGGTSLKAMEAVAAAIHNRANARGISPADVVRQPGQFEGYSNPGSGSKAAQKLDHVRTLAQKAWDNIQSGRTPDPLNGGTDFRAESAASGLHAPHGTVNIGGNVFALGKKPSEAEQAIEAVAPLPAPAPLTEGIAYGTPALASHSVHTIPINPLTGQPQSGTEITINGGTQVPLLLPSGKTILPGTYPSSDGTHSVTISDDGSGRAKITHNQQMGEIPGLINPAKELAPNSTSVIGNYLKSFVSGAKDEVGSKVAGAQASAGGLANDLGGKAEAFGTGAQDLGGHVLSALSPFGALFGMGGGSPHVPDLASSARDTYSSLPMYENYGKSTEGAPSLSDPNGAPKALGPRQILNPEWTDYQRSQEKYSPTLQKGEMFTSTGQKISGGQWAAMNYVGDEAYQSPAVLAPRAPAPPKYISAPGSSAQVPEDKVAQLVKLLSGKTVPVGTTGTSNGGAYDYVVQKDGSILNRTTGKITAAAPVPAPKAPAPAPGNSYLNTIGVDTSKLSSGQQANELNKALGSSDSHGSV